MGFSMKANDTQYKYNDMKKLRHLELQRTGLTWCAMGGEQSRKLSWRSTMEAALGYMAHWLIEHGHTQRRFAEI